MPSKQATFNRMIRHLRKQNCKAKSILDGFTKHYACCYFDPDTGNKCPAGCLIPKKDYKPEFESNRIVADYADQLMNKKNAHLECYFAVSILLDEKGYDLELVSAVQTIHDNYEVNSWEKQFEIVAKRFDLKVPKKEKK